MGLNDFGAFTNAKNSNNYMCKNIAIPTMSKIEEIHFP